MNRKKILFLCTGNSARSQMAEGLLRALSDGAVEAYSAGLEPKGLHPLAIRVMDEIGIDIRGQHSKSIDPDLLREMDRIVTVCAHADARCPATPPGVARDHWALEDPAFAEGTDAQRLAVFRAIRESLRERIVRFLEAI